MLKSISNDCKFKKRNKNTKVEINNMVKAVKAQK